MFLPWFGQVGDAGVGAHEDVAGVQPALQVQLLDLRQVDAAQRSLGQSVGRDQSQAEHAHAVDAVDGLRSGDEEGEDRSVTAGRRSCKTTRGLFEVIYLQHAAHPLEAVLLGGVGPLLGHHHDPLVPQHRHREHRYPAGVQQEQHQSEFLF